MKQHLNTDFLNSDENAVILCNQCKANFNTNNDLRDHMNKYHSVNDNNCITTDQTQSCDECDYKSTSEENVLNHKIAAHTESISILMNHFHDQHTNAVQSVPQFKCRDCPEVFTTKPSLDAHIRTHRTPSAWPCDYCGFKADSDVALDNHIHTFHRIYQSNNRIANPRLNNSGKNEPIPRRKTYTPQERLNNGPCYRWNECFCNFNDFCRYAHVKVCKFQEQSRSQGNCGFYHINKSNVNFLSSRPFHHQNSRQMSSHPVRNQVFQFRSQDFPPIQRGSLRRF